MVNGLGFFLTSFLLIQQESVPSLPQSPLKERPPKAFHQYSNNISTLDVHCLPQLQEKVSPPSSPPIMFPPAFEAAKVEAKPDELKVTVKLKPRLKAIHSSLDDCRPPSKKWKGMKWKKWSIQIVIPKGSFKPPCEEEIDEFLKKLGTTLKPDPVPKDYRKCCFCHEEGDGLTDGPARLLNLDLDLWVHLNCALWSTEVYETQAGALINVELALRRGLQMKCMFCHKMGATSGCHRLRCTNIYHFTCAIKAQCMFFKDKTMLCPMHKPKGTHEQELSYFAVFRRVYVQRDEVRQIASIVQRGERDHTFRVGSLIFHAVGQLLPQQMQAFHSSKALFPVGYEASRLYWSMRYANRRCRYLCSIEEKDGLPLFVIKVVEQGHEDLVLTDTTPKGKFCELRWRLLGICCLFCYYWYLWYDAWGKCCRHCSNIVLILSLQGPFLIPGCEGWGHLKKWYKLQIRLVTSLQRRREIRVVTMNANSRNVSAGFLPWEGTLFRYKPIAQFPSRQLPWTY